MIYRRFDVMLQDITSYIRMTGAEVLVEDDPENGYIGFGTADQAFKWQIPLRVLLFKKWALGKLEPEADSIRESLKSAAGRQAIITRLVNQAKVGIITDPEEIAKIQKQWHERRFKDEPPEPKLPPDVIS